MVRDRNTDRKRLFKRIPYQLFGWEPTHSHGIPTGTGTVTSDDGEAIAGMDDGAPIVGEFSTFGFGGVEIAAAGDSLTCLTTDILIDMDVSETIGVRVIYGVNATPGATDAVEFVVLFDQADIGEALAAPATALDTVIGTHTPGHTTASRLERTGRGVINANTFNEEAKLGSLAFNVEANTLTNYSADEVHFFSLEIDYLPHQFVKGELAEAVTVHTSQAASS